MNWQRESRFRQVGDGHFEVSFGAATLLKLSLIAFCLSSNCGRVRAAILPSQTCEEISSVEVRFRNYFPVYLAKMAKNERDLQHATLQKEGLVYQSVTKSARKCCSNIKISFVHLENATGTKMEYLIKASQQKNDSKQFVFFFPEFSDKGMTKVYQVPKLFLPVLKSAGHAIIMRKSEATAGMSPVAIILPSLPLIAVLFTWALLFGVVVWLLDHWKNAEQFPSPFIVGVFEGFWWAVVTMTTVGYGDKAPRTFCARMLTIIWMLVSFLLFTLIAANTTSIISTHQVTRIRRTIGLKIGATNSKDFVESELNLGAEIIEFNNSKNMLEALIAGDVDRVVFPKYVDFLVMTSLDSGVNLNDVYVAKVLDRAFQVGLVLSKAAGLNNLHHQRFYTCLSSAISEFKSKYLVQYSAIKQSDDDTTLGFMDTSDMIGAARTALYIIVGVIGAGLVWDIWKYMQRKVKRKQTANQSIELQQ